jgi:hypothetical protein
VITFQQASIVLIGNLAALTVRHHYGPAVPARSPTAYAGSPRCTRGHCRGTRAVTGDPQPHHHPRREHIAGVRREPMRKTILTMISFPWPTQIGIPEVRHGRSFATVESPCSARRMSNQRVSPTPHSISCTMQNCGTTHSSSTSGRRH